VKKIILTITVLVAFFAGSKLLLEDMLGLDLASAAAQWIDTAGAGSAAIIVGLLFIDIFLPVPSSVVMVLSGLAFGPFWGSLLSLAGSIGGEWVGFELARRYGQRFSNRVADDDELRRLADLFARRGAAAVVVTRALPVAMETLSVVAGLSGMRRATFLIASFIGTAPVVVLYAYAGAKSREMGSLLPAVIMLVAVAGAGWLWYRARIERVQEINRTGV
jgi:uncharacterized membrane protein YdjX (TVP38/TMEM64 family)